VLSGQNETTIDKSAFSNGRFVDDFRQAARCVTNNCEKLNF
jgi:hypothetical protein